MSALTDLPAWKALEAHAKATGGRHLRDFFREEPDRFSRYSYRRDDLLVDISKQRIDGETLRLLLDLAKAADVEGWPPRHQGDGLVLDFDVLEVRLAVRCGEGSWVAHS